MPDVYVLRSQSTGKLYVGFTNDTVQRLGQHNVGLTKSTRNRGPWKLIYSEPHPTRAEAMKRERYLKTGRGREEIKRLIAISRQAPSLHG